MNYPDNIQIKPENNYYKTMKCIEKNEYILTALIIILVVSIANIHTIYGLDRLVQDDNGRYFEYITDSLENTSNRSITGLAWPNKVFIVSLFSRYSVEHARLFVLFMYMIPLSFLFYLFNRKFLQLSLWTSLASAVLVNIIPTQYQIPAFLDGSYVAPGVLFFIATLIFASLYLEATRTNIILLIFTSTVWFVVCDTIAEMGIFLFPALLFIIYTSPANYRRKIYLYLTTTLITIAKIFTYIQLPKTPTNKPIELSLNEITSRITKSLEWWSPVGKDTYISVIFVILAISLTIFAYIKLRDSSDKQYLQRAYKFYFIWFLFAAAPFWLLTNYFFVRYFYIAYFGLTTMVLMAVHQLFTSKFRTNKAIFISSLFLIFFIYGFQRYIFNMNPYYFWNTQGKSISSLLRHEQINPGTQIVLANIHLGTVGFYTWSTGYLQHLLKEPEVRGIIGEEINFYDPFNHKHCSELYKMSCLNTNDRLIAYKWDSNYKFVRMSYFLQWKTQEAGASNWSLYGTNKDDQLHVISKGSGIDQYKTTLSELDIDPKDVLWGNYN